MTDAHRPVRWLVVGSSGAGKSTLSRALGSILGLPVIHLDLHFWNTGWVETPTDEWEEKNRRLVAGDEWIIDGNYSGTLNLRLPRADRVILIDLPPWRCVWRVLKRFRSSGTSPRPDIPADCPDQMMDRQFLWYIVSYRWRSRPKVLRLVAAHPNAELTVLRSDHEIAAFLEQTCRAEAEA